MKPIDRAIEHAGGLAELARLLEVSPQVITNWKARGIPLDRCADIERVTGGAVKRTEIYPDHFGPIRMTG